jgi:urease accessory protein
VPDSPHPFLAGRMQRANGAARLEFGPRGLVDLYQRTPCRFIFPRVESGEPPCAVMVTTTGGLTGGDQVRFDIVVQDGARGTVTSQAAEKIYRAATVDAVDVQVTLQAAAGAWLEWLPQESILFDRARLIRRTVAHLHPTARLLACEMVYFGRTAHGEAFRTGLLHDSWRLTVADRLVWADALHLDDDIPGTLADPFAFGGARAVATVIYAGPDSAELRSAARALLGSDDTVRAGVTLVQGVLLARFVAPDAAQLRATVVRYLEQMRALAGGLPAQLPRLWYT